MSVMSIMPNLELEGDSINFKNWESLYLDIKTCEACRKKHGKIYSFNTRRYQPEHDRCRCRILPMRTVIVGDATNMGFNGADAWLMFYKILPDYYVTKEEAIDAGWDRRKGNLSDVLPGKMIGGNVYKNRLGKLPESPGRIWYEADFDYVAGYRNTNRILYSNDGLIFVSYDHAQTFFELVEEKPKNARYI